ncbi:sorbitol dehydrogenase-like protein [Rhizophagus irregularis]|nr:sorbitol dehydrogenase-like protein [Rhizophagus irregularis DAOM 181602=DAOM 197198]PKC15382.1 sorbitol dehydrogenase-like protein [Rhizophagus irregularis]PKC58708.1 sorbitol dehydrogenase-like protein [Rhizophagus irregularis]PKK80146.1 sorbitol dehydrogenase-like protein [Rhizophagus irregularis]PKY16934.1 sorbitol dehydrogenase-like protein [Rhizophagus irregularis]PKY37813.1 sorbitol dehydrogenase-like protein [Rhizophagus irregularis]|eukprot:XP_025185065.1 sorbitol dehydrogenase-like protein [Rhizophagus irregularis DAOM 181602=DAOM 197198]
MPENSNISWVLKRIGDIQAENRPRPSPKPNEVEIAVKVTGICGSDVHYWVQGHIGDFIVKEPMVLGHESSGIVTNIGRDCKILKVGDQVAIEPGIPCYICHFCKNGQYNLCKDMKFAATPPINGTLCQYYCCPEDFCVKLPDNFPSLEEAALIEPLSVGIHSCKLADLRAGQTVIIFGAGPVGLLAGAAAKASGAVKITMVDINQSRLDFAKNYVANEVVLAEREIPQGLSSVNFAKRFSQKLLESGVEQADVILECSGVETCIQTGIYMTKSKGTFVQVGMGMEVVPIPIADIGVREIKFMGSFRYCNTYKQAVQLVSAGFINLKPLITHRFKFQDAVKAFETVKERKDNVIKALILGTDTN